MPFSTNLKRLRELSQLSQEELGVKTGLSKSTISMYEKGARKPSFEVLEAARWLPFLRPGGQIVTSTQQIDPMPVVTGKAEYPENLVDKMRAAGVKVDALDCLSLAAQAGSSKAVNIVLMGRLSHYFDLPEEKWMQALEAVVPAKFLELNKKAFALGRNA